MCGVILSAQCPHAAHKGREGTVSALTQGGVRVATATVVEVGTVVVKVGPEGGGALDVTFGRRRRMKCRWWPTEEITFGHLTAKRIGVLLVQPLATLGGGMRRPECICVFLKIALLWISLSLCPKVVLDGTSCFSRITCTRYFMCRYFLERVLAPLSFSQSSPSVAFLGVAFVATSASKGGLRTLECCYVCPFEGSAFGVHLDSTPSLRTGPLKPDVSRRF